MRDDTPILVVGQTPPPYGGQAIMIDALLQGPYEGVTLHHVRMRFSRTMEEIGRLSARKIIELFRLIYLIHRTRIRSGARILYYPPAGPEVIPVLRDMVVLLFTRPFFDRTVFHFHAAGVGEFECSLPAVLRPLFRLAYAKPDVAIRISRFAPDDGNALGADRCIVIPNGVADRAMLVAGKDRSTSHSPIILFVGLLCERKGTDVLLEACGHLRDGRRDFRLRLVGSFASPEEEARLRDVVRIRSLAHIVEFTGMLTGEEKWTAFAEADIFCYPTHHETETFGIAAVEAMSFGLPVVATRWRGLTEIVVEGETGLLVPTRDSGRLAEALHRLLQDRSGRRAMGRAGRSRYVERFSLETFHEAFAAVFAEEASRLDRGER